jgi:hypothetical protein
MHPVGAIREPPLRPITRHNQHYSKHRISVGSWEGRSPLTSNPNHQGMIEISIQTSISRGLRSQQTSPSFHSSQRIRLFRTRYLFHHHLHPSSGTGIRCDRGWENAIKRIWVNPGESLAMVGYPISVCDVG